MGNSAHWSSAMRGPWHVAVLMGGWSAERSVSLMSGEGVAKALESRGHKVTLIDMGHDVAARLTETAPDVVFNALHAVAGEHGPVPGMMDLMGIKDTPRGLASAVIAIANPRTTQTLVPPGIPITSAQIVDTQSNSSADPTTCTNVMKLL